MVKEGHAEEHQSVIDAVPIIDVMNSNCLYAKRMSGSVKMKPETEMTSLTFTKTIMKKAVRTTRFPVEVENDNPHIRLPATAAALSLEETVLDGGLLVIIS